MNKAEPERELPERTKKRKIREETKNRKIVVIPYLTINNIFYFLLNYPNLK
jgi:hypothetical protein